MVTLKYKGDGPTLVRKDLAGPKVEIKAGVTIDVSEPMAKHLRAMYPNLFEVVAGQDNPEYIPAEHIDEPPKKTRKKAVKEETQELKNYEEN